MTQGGAPSARLAGADAPRPSDSFPGRSSTRAPSRRSTDAARAAGSVCPPSRTSERRYSPSRVLEVAKVPLIGEPDTALICTSHIERQNLTMRMHIRRLTRLTNAFSKKWDNLRAALALHFAYYNFCKQHSRVRVTPAMESGITDHAWSLVELLAA